MKESSCYIVAGSKPWNKRIFDNMISTNPGQWFLIQDPQFMSPDNIDSLSPKYIFFLHWSWKVPKEITERYECICFHMTDLPYGRGGSPLQNLIIRGKSQTKLTALRMNAEIDAGPIYLKEQLCLRGGAEEIYIRTGRLASKMIKEIIRSEMVPKPQQGDPVIFERRNPQQSRITEGLELSQLHDFIRMLDADGYPRAFIEHGGFRLEFSRSSLYDGRIIADVKITEIGKSTS